jgi:hypothetical protein
VYVYTSACSILLSVYVYTRACGHETTCMRTSVRAVSKETYYSVKRDLLQCQKRLRVCVLVCVRARVRVCDTTYTVSTHYVHCINTLYQHTIYTIETLHTLYQHIIYTISTHYVHYMNTRQPVPGLCLFSASLHPTILVSHPSTFLPPYHFSPTLSLFSLSLSPPPPPPPPYGNVLQVFTLHVFICDLRHLHR